MIVILGSWILDDVLYAINGPTKANNPVMGFTVKPDRDSVVAVWGPTFDVSINCKNYYYKYHTFRTSCI